jgi:hypothetical protein
MNYAYAWGIKNHLNKKNKKYEKKNIWSLSFLLKMGASECMLDDVHFMWLLYN